MQKELDVKLEREIHDVDDQSKVVRSFRRSCCSGLTVHFVVCSFILFFCDSVNVDSTVDIKDFGGNSNHRSHYLHRVLYFSTKASGTDSHWREGSCALWLNIIPWICDSWFPTRANDDFFIRSSSRSFISFSSKVYSALCNWDRKQCKQLFLSCFSCVILLLDCYRIDVWCT